MKAKLFRLLDAVRTGFWFLPMLMLGAAAVLAWVLLRVDRHVDPGLQAVLRWTYSGGPEGARSLLSTIAGSMITAASVTFSLASVALSIASQQYGSRVLRNFMRDRITQVLLGTFVATFIYSVLVVRAIRGSDYGGGFVPGISVTVALGLSLCSLVLLIYFIHHVSSSIQASHIVQVIAHSLEQEIPKLYPSRVGEGVTDEAAPAADAPAATVQAACTGYLQSVDADALLRAAAEADVWIRVCVRPGDHLLAGDALAEIVAPAGVSADLRSRVAGAFYLARQRTPLQDIRYSFQQLTDVVVRALSPGINDPFTAMNGIDELGGALLLLAGRDCVASRRAGEHGRLRLMLPAVSLADVLHETIGHIAVYAGDDPFVQQRLRRALLAVERSPISPADQEAVQQLHRQLDKLQREAAASP